MKVYEKLKKYAKERIGYAYLSVFFSLLASSILMASYWFLWKFLKELLGTRNMKNVEQYALWILFSMIGYTIFYFFSLWCSHLVAFRLETNLRKEGIQHLLEASFAFYDKNPSGKIRKIIDDNAAETHTIVAHLLPDLVSAIAIPLWMLCILFFVDLRLGFSLVFMMLLGAYQIKDMVGEKEFMEQYMLALEKMNAEAVEYIRGIQVIKIFKNTVYSLRAFYDSIVSYSTLALDYSYSCRRAYVLFQVVFHLFITFTLPFAIFFLQGGENPKLLLAKLVFYICLAGTLFVSFMRVMYLGMYEFQAVQAIEKVESFFSEMEEGKEKQGTEKTMEHFDIEFRGVSFQYKEEKVLDNLSFRLEEKKTYAFVGSSGGGKSTIAKLIAGFYSIAEGEILIGGKNIREYSEESLMSHIAFVFQNTKLSKTSIFENVKMGRDDASDEEVMEALKQARCEEILDKFEEREHTRIGSEGVYLSGGETQRIAIARAILKNAEIVILDEASAAADPENEYEIQQAFSNLMKSKTVIMIAHRLSSIRNVDEILVFEKGRLIERGKDQDLMQERGKYQKLQHLFSQANQWRVSL